MYAIDSHHFLSLTLIISLRSGLRANGLQIFDIESDSQTILYIELHDIIDKFVQKYGFESIVAIVSDNPYLSSTIRLVEHREVSVVLIYGRNSSQELVLSTKDRIAFDDIFGLNRTGIYIEHQEQTDNNSMASLIVILLVSNLPAFKSRNAIRTAFQPFCRQFHCKFRFVRKDTIKLEFNNLIDAQNAELKASSKEFLGHQLVTELKILSECQNSSPSELSSPPESLISMRLSQNHVINPQKDDECKSVIIGLFSQCNQNVYNLVRDLVNSWNDQSVNGTMILRVNRERDFLNRDGKASLIVTAIDRKASTQLIAAAKKMFVDRKNKLFWNRLRRSPKKDSNQNTDCEDFTHNGPNCRSVVIGLWTRHDENVLKTIKNLVKSWQISGFDIKCITHVERSKKFSNKDGKAALIVSTDSPENNEKLLAFASIKFHDKNKKFYWKSIQQSAQSTL